MYNLSSADSANVWTTSHAANPRVLKLLVPGLFFAVNVWLLTLGEVRLIAVVLFVASLVVTSVLDRNLGICLVFAYLALMGDIRRVTSFFLGFPKFDSLLLVAPLLVLWIVAPVFLHLRFTNLLSKGVAALMAIMLLEVFNPKQGGLIIGVTGSMFYLVPLLWYWIGRHFGTPRLVEQALLRFVFPLGIAASVLGIWQTSVGFLPWEQAWIDSGLMNVGVGEAVRAFGFSVAPASYAALLVATSLVAWARFLSGRKLWLLALPLLLAAVVLASQRGATLRLVLGFAVIWGLRRIRARGFVLQIGLALVCLLAVVYLLAAQFSGGSRFNPNAKGVQALLDHEAGGLSHPLDAKHSTAGLHMRYFGAGLVNGLENPLGFGLGSTTAAASKVGGTSNDRDSSAFGTELDFTDMFQALGPIGGIVYVGVVLLAFSSALRFVKTSDQYVGLMIMGILVANVGGLLISGEYFMSSLVWLLIGVTSRGDDLMKLAQRRVSSESGTFAQSTCTS